VDQSVVPMLTYADGPAAMDWLARAFGFVEQTRWLDDDGRVAHGEMVAGDGLVMIASTNPTYEGPTAHRTHCDTADSWLTSPYVVDGVLVYVDDIDAHYEQAVAAGAPTLSEVEDGGPGRLYRTEDVEGHRWMFMQRS
jgi:PhnB protein